MSEFKVQLLAKKEIAHGTMAFVFSKPEGFEFKAGQSCDFTLINPSETDAEGNKRAFSLCNPPHSSELMIATRMRDTAFKRVLKNLPLKSELLCEGPFGDFTLHNNVKKTAIFLTGGIGITPVRSIVLQATQAKLQHKIHLFYANNKPEDAAFLEELQNLEKVNKNYNFVGTMADISHSKKEWKGAVGFIDKNLLTKDLTELSQAVYYICGPAGMVVAMRKMLNGIGVDDDDIRTEEFSGY